MIKSSACRRLGTSSLCAIVGVHCMLTFVVMFRKRLIDTYDSIRGEIDDSLYDDHLRHQHVILIQQTEYSGFHQMILFRLKMIYLSSENTLS